MSARKYVESVRGYMGEYTSKQEDNGWRGKVGLDENSNEKVNLGSGGKGEEEVSRSERTERRNNSHATTI